MPDFMVRMPVRGQMGKVSVLAELKVLSCCQTRYARGPRTTEKAVTRRANQLPGEYKRKAQRMDREFGGVSSDKVGPVESKLARYPFQSWVFGAWNEASSDIHELVHVIASSRMETEWESQRGGCMAKYELSFITGQVRRSLSLVSAQAQAKCLFDRVETLGTGGKEANRRRRWLQEEERRLEKEQKAHMLSLQRGKDAFRRGDFFLQ